MKNLKKLRRDSGLTQYGLAGATGIHRWRISHAELGLITLTPEEIDMVRRILVAESKKKSERVLSALAAA